MAQMRRKHGLQGKFVAKNKKEEAKSSTSQALLRRVLPSLAFATALALLVAFFYDPGYPALAGLEKRYEQSRRAVAVLRLDDKAASRESWEKLADEFKAVYESAPGWPNKPDAVFYRAECLEESARLSLAAQDTRRAVNAYEEFASRYPQNVLTDDALLRAARLRAAWLKDEKGALAVISAIKKRHSTGEPAPEVIALEKILAAAARGRTAPEARNAAIAEKQETAGENSAAAFAPGSVLRQSNAAGTGVMVGGAAKTAASKSERTQKSLPARLTMLAWDSKNQDSVEITLVLSGYASSSSRMLKSPSGGRMRLTLDKVLPVKEVEESVSVRASLLRGIRTSVNNGSTVLDIDFRQEVDIVTSQSPGRIIVRAEAVKKPSAPGEEKRVAASANQIVHPSLSKADVKKRRLGGMADQLGLTVGRVFIDPGHGGRDPGAEKNNVSERRVTLEVAQTLGRLLEAGGLEVAYSRTADKTVQLNERTGKANEVGADIFVSIHVNANDDPSVNGLEVYYLDFAANVAAARVAALENASGNFRLGDMQRLMAEVMVNARVEESRRLAGNIQQLTSSRLRQKDFAVKSNGVKAAPFHVLIGAHMPAVLVEIGYCTNSAEARRLASPAYRQALAEGLAEGILAYKKSLKRTDKMQAELEQ
jgi:N-acetylmuramoyl-L-alanine amidase